MTGQAPRTRDDELLLARISEAAGREHLGRRRATCPVAPDRPGAAVCLLLGRWSRRRYEGARLDLYEYGLTAAAQGRIQVVRYDTTSVFQRRAGYTLTDVHGKQVSFRDVQHWGPEILRGVTDAQLPRALAALDNGERIAFGRHRLGIPVSEIPNLSVFRALVSRCHRNFSTATPGWDGPTGVGAPNGLNAF